MNLLRQTIKPVLQICGLAASVVLFGMACSRNAIADGIDTALKSGRNDLHGVPAEIQILLDEASEAKSNGSFGFAGYYIGMAEEKAEMLTAYYRDKAKRRGLFVEDKPYTCTPNSKLVSSLHFTPRAMDSEVLESVYGVSPASFDGVKRSLGTVSTSTSKEVKCNFRMHDHMVYEFKSEKGHSAKITKGDNRDSIIYYGMDLQIEGPIVSHSGREEALSNIRMASTNALSELAFNMVQLPGKDYYVCKYKVTKALWFSIMGNPGHDWYLDEHTHPDQSVSVTYSEAAEFIAKLNKTLTGHQSGFVYRLPTFGEWEFACRAGAKDGYCQLGTGEIISDDTFDKVGEVIMIDSVGKRLPNAWGLYDMLSGLELTSDLHDGKPCVGSRLAMWHLPMWNMRNLPRATIEPGKTATLRVWAESDRKKTEEQRAAELAAEKHRVEEAVRKAEEAKAEAERRRQHEVEMAKLKMAEEARKAEAAKAEAERERQHEEEMAKLRKEKHKADQTRYAEYAEKALSEMKLDPMAYFKIQASLRQKLGKCVVKTAKWNQLEQAQKERNWLQMLSILSDASQSEYPTQERLDSLIKDFFSETFKVKFEGGFPQTEQVGYDSFGRPFPSTFSPKCFRISVNGIGGLSMDGAWDRHDDGMVEFIPSLAAYFIAFAEPLSSSLRYNGVIDTNQFVHAPEGVIQIATQLRDGEISRDEAGEKIASLYKKVVDDFMTWLDTH